MCWFLSFTASWMWIIATLSLHEIYANNLFFPFLKNHFQSLKKKGDVSFQGLTTPDKTFLYLSHKLSVEFKDSVVLAPESTVFKWLNLSSVYKVWDKVAPTWPHSMLKSLPLQQLPYTCFHWINLYSSPVGASVLTGRLQKTLRQSGHPAKGRFGTTCPPDVLQFLILYLNINKLEDIRTVFWS